MAVASLPAVLVSSAVAQTVVTGGDPPTVISAEDLQAAGTLSFVAGSTSEVGNLQVTSSGTFSNSWSLNDAVALFNLTGNNLTIASAVVHAGNVATGTCTIGVQNGTLTLGQNSFLTGFTGTLQATSIGAIVIEQGDWLSNASTVNLDTTAGSATLTWAGSSAQTYAGALVLAGAGDATISTVAGAGTLNFNGAISGPGDVTFRAAGVTPTPAMVLAFTGGFAGQTAIDSALVRIDTQASIGSIGLLLDGATVTAGTNLSIGASQVLNIVSDSTIVGTAGPEVVNIPRSALIRSGTEDRVVVALGDGRFAPRRVVAGAESGERVAIKDGLAAGENVVVAGQFLLDSEANLRAGFERLEDPAP